MGSLKSLNEGRWCRVRRGPEGPACRTGTLINEGENLLTNIFYSQAFAELFRIAVGKKRGKLAKFGGF